MAGTTPVISHGVPPGGNVSVNETLLPQGSNPSRQPVQGTWSYTTIEAEDGVKEFRVGSYVAIRDGVFTAGYSDYGYGRLWVDGYDAATGKLDLRFELTAQHTSAQAGRQLKYGDLLYVPMVLTDADGEQVSQDFVVQIRDDEGIALEGESYVARPGAPLSGNVINSADQFGADGFGKVVQVVFQLQAYAEEDGEFIVRGAYGNLILTTEGSFTYQAFPDAPNGAQDRFTYRATDGDGDQDSADVVFTIENGAAPPPPQGQAINSPGAYSTIVAGEGSDTITASAGGDTITSGGGSDVIVFRGAPWAPVVLTDFRLGTDRIDFQELNSVYGGSDPVADRYIVFLDDGAGGTKVLYDRDGAGAQQEWPQYVFHLQTTPAAGLTWNQLANPGAPPPAPDNQPTISATRGGPPGGVTLTTREANLANGTSPDAAALTQRGELFLQAADGVDDVFSGQTVIIRDGVFTPVQVTTPFGHRLAFTTYDSATGKLSFEYTLTHAEAHDPSTNDQPRVFNDGVSLLLIDADGDRAGSPITLNIVDDVPVTRDDADTVVVGGGAPATGDVVTDASQGDAGDSDNGRDLRGADQAVIYGLSSVNTGASIFNTYTNGQLVISGQYGVLKMGLLGEYSYTLNADAPVGAVDRFTYVLKDNDQVTGRLEITATPGSTSGGQRYVSPGPNSNVSGGSGDDTLVASQGGDTMTGGAGNDVISLPFKPWSPVEVTDFVVGSDRLDLSSLLQSANYSGSDPIADKYVGLIDDGAGGTKVLFDRDATAPGQQWPDYIVHLQKVPVEGLSWAKLTGSGGATEPPPPPPPPTGEGQVINSAGPGSTLQGTAGNDTLNASQGSDTLIGAGGADHFVFAKENWAPAVIKDFEPGVDKIDIRGMLDAVGYAGTDPIGAGYLTLVGDGAGGTIVLFDRDLSGPNPEWPNYVFKIENKGPGDIAAGDWIFQ